MHSGYFGKGGIPPFKRFSGGHTEDGVTAATYHCLCAFLKALLTFLDFQTFLVASIHSGF